MAESISTVDTTEAVEAESRSLKDCAAQSGHTAADGIPGCQNPAVAAMDTIGCPRDKGDVQSADDTLQEETTVEVCVKMVVCRKIISRTVDPKTGKVISTSTRMEEDPPTIMDVHSYTTTTTTAAASTTTTNNAEPAVTRNSSSTPVVRRRPGRPRKHPPALTPAPNVRTVSALNQTGSSEETAAVPEGPTGMDVEQPSSRSEGSQDGNEGPCQAVNNGREMVGKKSATGWKASDKRSVRGKRKMKTTPGPVKRGRVRPSRVIKRPKKYLDSYGEEFFKPEPDSDSQEDAQEDDSEEEDTGEEKEEGKKEEEGKDDSKDGQELPGDQAKTEGTEEEEGGDQRTECSKCGKKFSTFSNCQRHMAKDRCKREHQCGFCDKLFSTRILLERHVEGHRDQDDPDSFRCSDCNRSYATRNGYLKHKRQGTCYKRDVFNEDGTQGEFECQVCHVRFTTEKLLALHKEKVHENPTSEYKCPDCGRVFYSKLGFSKHAAKKSCTQPHVCKVCGKKYSNKAKESYKSHMRYHLAETSGVQYQCEDCGRVYITDMALKKHRLTSHSGVRPYKCSICSKTFPMRYMVRDHERSHTGEKPFLCNLCGTSFSNRGHLYRHMRSHQLGTLHKRGRPRKYPQGKPLVLSFPKQEGETGEGEEAVGELVERGEGGELGVVEIKADPLPPEGQEDLAGSMMEGGSTYITVHTIDGQLTDQAATQAIMGDGQLQHVVMETPDGMTENMVLQVIRDLTGATTVYQHVAESPVGSSTANMAAVTQQPQILMSSSQTESQPPQLIMSSSHADSQPPQILMSSSHADNQQPQIIMSSSHADNQQPQIIMSSSHADNQQPQIIMSSSHADGQQPQIIVPAPPADSQQLSVDSLHPPLADSSQLLAGQPLPASAATVQSQPRIIVASPPKVSVVPQGR